MSKNKNWKKRGFILVGSIAFILITNLIISSIIKQKLTDFLLKNESRYYKASVEKVDFKLLRRSLTLTNVYITPREKSIDSLKDKTSKKTTLENISLSSVSIKGIGVFNILVSSKIDVNSVVFNDLLIHKFTNSNINKKIKKTNSINIDSINLGKLNGLDIDNIIFNNFQYEVYDYALKKTTFKSNPLSFKSSGLVLNPLGNHYFKLSPAKEKFEINNIKLNLENIQYNFSIDKISLNFKEKFINLSQLKFEPQIDKYKLANSYKYNDPVYNASIENLTVYNLKLSKLIEGKGLYIDSLNIEKLNLAVFKDKQKPFDINKRPGLPHTGLKRMKFPLYVQKVTVADSDVLIEAKMEKSNVLMSIPISDLNASITNITSIKSFRENPMMLTADAVLMKTAKSHLNAKFMLKDHQNTFYFNGFLGSSKMKMFDSALYPVLGLKVLEGDLDELTFSASANESESNGKMTMLYHNLEAEVYKSKTKKENKFLSWTVNSIVKKSNPKKNKPASEVHLHAERVNYKGLGNYFWKTLQNGIINTIAGRKETDKSKNQKKK